MIPRFRAVSIHLLVLSLTSHYFLLQIVCGTEPAEVITINNGNQVADWKSRRGFPLYHVLKLGFSRSPMLRTVLLVNGTADDSFFLTTKLEENKSLTDYAVRLYSNNSKIANSETDVSIAHVESGTYLNTSVAVDFHNFPGIVALTFEIRRLSDNSTFDSVQVIFLVAGAVFFDLETESIISGAERHFTISSYTDIYGKSHWEFGLFVQFLNGSDSSSLLFHPINKVPAIYLSSFSAELTAYSGQLVWDNDVCSIDGGLWRDGEVHLPAGCGMGISAVYGNDSAPDGLRFAINFEKNRAGILSITFTWVGFTVESEVEDEEFTTTLTIEIGGDPPAIVRRIEPAITFSKYGGEELYIETINTADVNITAFNVNDVPFPIVNGSRSFTNGPVDFYESAKFLTQPGSGKNIPWTISAFRIINGTIMDVVFEDETGFLFSYDDDSISISSVTPNRVPESGEVYVVVTGSFTHFDPNISDHNVYFGSVLIDKSRIVSSSSSEITVLVPPHYNVGESWDFEVLVQIGDSFSNQFAVQYQPSGIVLRGLVFGSSLDDSTNTHILNPCGSTTFVVSIIEQRADNATFKWFVYDNTKLDLLSFENASEIIKNTASFELPNNFIPRFGEVFHVTVRITLGDLDASETFAVKKSDAHLIGVTLIQPENRTISTPPVNLRVIAKIEVPRCLNISGELVYEWEYENKSETLSVATRMGMSEISVHDDSLHPQFVKYIFSFQNDTGTFEGDITPTRLGRELVVPREMIEYGLHRVRLTVRGNTTDHTGAWLTGSDSTSFTVHEAPLVAMIGTGQISRRVSDSENLVMSAKGSFDPDAFTLDDPSFGLDYEWSCIFSLVYNFSSFEVCSRQLLPENSVREATFDISSTALKTASIQTIEGANGNVYIKYSIIVKKFHRTSNATQTLTLARSAGQLMARYTRIEIVNFRDEYINPNAVEFWEDVIIRPLSISPTTEWRFRLEMPMSERSRFLSSGENLIPRAGYYQVISNIAPGFQQLPLGIRADKLHPHQLYQFVITFQEPGRISDDVVVQLKTVEMPELVMQPLLVSYGSTETIFRATATTSFHGNSLFTYQFYLLEQGKETREYCVDGCTGAHTVRFQIPKPGRYILQCRLLAATGRTLLSVKNHTQLLTVSSSAGGTGFAEFDFSIMKDYYLGDDGSVTQKGFFVSQSIHERDGQVVAMSESSGEQCATYTLKWAQIAKHIVTNEFPNTLNARNYVIFAANYARLLCVEYEDTLYELLAIVERSIAKTPQEEMLTMASYSRLSDIPKVELQEDLLRFYNFSVTRAASIIARGSSRRRLMPQEGIVSNLILDIVELWMKHVTTTSTSGQVCGWDETYSLETSDGMSDRFIVEDSLRSPLGKSTIRVAVKCNAEQGRLLETEHASFEWCNTVYTVSGASRKLVTLAETFDYPYISGVQGQNRSETERIVMVDITTLGERNQLVSAMSSESVVAAQAAEGNGQAKTCYRIGMKLAPVVTMRAAYCWINRPFIMWPRKSYGRQFKTPFENDAYMQRTSGISASADTVNSSENVIAQSNELGLYGAGRVPCDENLTGDLGGLEGAGVTIAGILIGILVLIIVITGLTYLLVSAIVGIGAQGDDDSNNDDSAATAALAERYVERDYFGRKEVRLNLASMDSAAASGYDMSQRSLLPPERDEDGPRIAPTAKVENCFNEDGHFDVLNSANNRHIDSLGGTPPLPKWLPRTRNQAKPVGVPPTETGRT